MTSKIIFTAAALLVGVATNTAVARTSNFPLRSTAAQASREAFDWVSPTSAAVPNAHRYHGGPKSND